MSIQQHDEFFHNGTRYYTQEQLDAAVEAAYVAGQNETQEHIGNPVSYAVGHEQAIRDCIAAVRALDRLPGGFEAFVHRQAVIARMRALLDGAE